MVICSITFTFRTPYVKNRRLAALNKRRRLDRCTSMLQVLGEAKRPHSGTSLARHTFLEVPKQISALFQAIFTPFFVVQFHVVSRFVFEVFPVTFRCLLVCLSVLHVGMSPRESFHDAASGLPPVPLRRCVGKQTPSAPEVQFRDVVLSDESFFLLHEQPNDQNTSMCWCLHCFAIVFFILAVLGACMVFP